MKKIINKVIVFTLIFNISIIINAISIRAAGDDDKKVYTELDENVRNIQDSKDACIGVEGETEPNEMIEYSRATTKPGLRHLMDVGGISITMELILKMDGNI